MLYQTRKQEVRSSKIILYFENEEKLKHNKSNSKFVLDFETVLNSKWELTLENVKQITLEISEHSCSKKHAYSKMSQTRNYL